MAGCAAMKKSGAAGGDELPEMSRRYLEALRWKNFQAASRYWIRDRRASWLEAMEAEEDLVNYQSLEVREVRPLPDENKVEIRVRVQMYRNDTLVVEKKNLVLVWERIDESWFIVDERMKPLGASVSRPGG